MFYVKSRVKSWCVTILCISLALSVFVHAGGVTQTSPCNQELADISVFPGDEEYHNSTLLNNPAFSDILPAFVALPKTISDVQRCLSCAYKKSVPFTMKCGGHCSEGYSTIDGTKNGAFVIFLSKMNRIDFVSNMSLKIQAGARWENVYSVVNESDYLIVGGTCPSVGASGFTLGGGMSFLSRQYGLAIDSVLSFSMVTSNGSNVVIANSTTNADLYWALRGGGGGNFGVVIDFTYQLQPSFPAYWLGHLTYSSEEQDADGNISNALLLIAQLDFPHELQLDFSLTNELVVGVVHLGTISQDTQKKIDSLKQLATSQHFNLFSSYWALYNTFSNRYPQIEKYPYIVKGCFLKTISEGFVERLRGVPLPGSCLHSFNHNGGAVATRKSDETAYFYRESPFNIYSRCSYHNDTELKIVHDFLNSLYDSFDENGYCVGNYVNDIDRELYDWQKKYYGNNYNRLLEIQEKWNPLGKGTYHFLQSIGSNYNPPHTHFKDNGKSCSKL